MSSRRFAPRHGRREEWKTLSPSLRFEHPPPLHPPRPPRRPRPADRAADRGAEPARAAGPGRGRGGAGALPVDGAPPHRLPDLLPPGGLAPRSAVPAVPGDSHAPARGPGDRAAVLGHLHPRRPVDHADRGPAGHLSRCAPAVPVPAASQLSGGDHGDPRPAAGAYGVADGGRLQRPQRPDPPRPPPRRGGGPGGEARLGPRFRKPSPSDAGYPRETMSDEAILDGGAEVARAHLGWEDELTPEMRLVEDLRLDPIRLLTLGARGGKRFRGRPGGA